MMRRRILVIDRVIACDLAEDCELVAASDGQDALARVEHGERFDLILSGVRVGVPLHTAMSRLARDQADRIVFVADDADGVLDRLPNTVLRAPVGASVVRALLS